MTNADGRVCQHCGVALCEHVEVGQAGSQLAVAPGRPGYTHHPVPANLRSLTERLEAGRRLPVDTERGRFVA